ncbi:hypothetical protein ACF0H5_024040 [Mactra antiquata]
MMEQETICNYNYTTTSPGKCKYGCKDGYFGGRCWNKCPEYCTICTREFAFLVHPENYQKCYLCTDGYYNGTGITNCSTPCPVNCAENQCNKTTGDCLQGCKYNWTGEKCTICPEDNNCNVQCPSNCKNGSCYNNGTCTDGCADDAFTGTRCNQCIVGKYGVNCEEDCPKNCIGDVCNRDDGTCAYGCISTYGGDKCGICASSYYGTNCYKRCYNCLNGLCDRVTGRCTDCVNGKYGELCDKLCSTGCKNSVCDRNTAVCAQGCKSGYSGDECCVKNNGCEKCDTMTTCSKCKTGTFGNACGRTCHMNCIGACDKNTGKCETCNEGKFYGEKCEKQCSSNCLDGKCAKEHGLCYSCENGYYGNTCGSACPNNCFFMEPVARAMGCVLLVKSDTMVLHNCLNNVCGQHDGICNNCTVGYYSKSCDLTCSKDCILNYCIQETGACTYQCHMENAPQSSGYSGEIVGGIIAGFTVMTIVSHVLCFLWRRRRTQDSNKETSIPVNPTYGNDNYNHTGYEDLQITGQ